MDLEALFRSVRRQESGGDPNAVSPKGAIGVMQIMPDTAMDPGFGLPNIFEVARSLGYDVPEENRQVAETLLRQPDINEPFGQAYLIEMVRNFRSPDKALAAYNAGPGFVEDWSGRFEDLPKETQGYIRNIRGFYESETGEQLPGVLPPPARGSRSMDMSSLRQPAGEQRNLFQGIGHLVRNLVDPEYRAEQEDLQLAAVSSKRNEILSAMQSGDLSQGEGERLLLGLEEQSGGVNPMGLINVLQGVAQGPRLPQQLPTTISRSRGGSGTSAIQRLGVKPLA